MVLIEREPPIELWGQPVANSAQLLTADGKPRGLLIESDAGLRFRAAGEEGSRFELPWPAIRSLRSPFLSPRRLVVATDDGRHRFRLTDAVIDKPLSDDAPDGGDADSFPIEGGARPTNITREEAMLDDAATAVGALVVIIGWVAADRVRRRRVAGRIIARAGL